VDRHSARRDGKGFRIRLVASRTAVKLPISRLRDVHGLVTGGSLNCNGWPNVTEGIAGLMPRFIKPRTLGVLAKAERLESGASYILSALGLFDLARPEADRFESEQALWTLSAKALPKGAVLDVGMVKPRAELLVGGAARTPSGTTATSQVLEWSVGPLKKRLAVIGDRVWRINQGRIEPTAPLPFTEMPISPERAYGGPGFADNPAGRGFRAGERIGAGELVALPNIEFLDQPVLSPESAPPPALCGPIDPASPKRRRFAGTYDGHWLKTRAPAMPEDVDPRLFLTAPDDQVFPGFLVGGEPYALKGFAADAPEIRGYIPKFRVRGFLARKGKDGAPGELVEIAMRLDTLWLFAGARRGVVIYRGAMPVGDIDGEDLSEAMLAYERADDPPRSLASYVDVWMLRRDPDTAFEHAFSESQLAPAISPETAARRSEERKALARERIDRLRAAQAWMLERKLDQAGVPAALRPSPPAANAELEDDILDLVLPTPEEIEEGEVDLAALLDSIRAQEAKVDEKTRRLVAQRDSLIAVTADARKPGAEPQTADALFSALDELTGTKIGASVADSFSGMSAIALPETADAPLAGANKLALESAKDWRTTILKGMRSPAEDDDTAFAAARGRFLDLPDSQPLHHARTAIEAAKAKPIDLPDFPTSPAAPEADGAADQLSALLDSLEAGLSPSGDLSTIEERTARLGSQRAAVDKTLSQAFPKLDQGDGSALQALLGVVASPAGPQPEPLDAGERWARVESERAQTLASTLDKIDEQEKRLREGVATARRASPEPTRPATPLGPAVARRLGELIKSEAKAGLSLRGRDLAGADLKGADLTGADLEGAFFERADLSGAKLCGARLVDTVLAGAILDGADLSDADLTGANLSKCRARGADFTRCGLFGGLILEADFTGAILRSARFTKSQFVNGVLDEADLSAAMIDNAQFMRVSLERVDFSGASLEATCFMDVPMTAARFRQARLSRCLFIKARAAGADFEAADLQRTTFLGQADLTKARFALATGADCAFQEAKLSGADFAGARFDRATFQKSDLSGASLARASLRGAVLSGATLVGADLIAVNLLKAQLRKADLSGARLIHANLYGANLDNAVLLAADLSGANLTKTYLAIDSHAG
jgi:uncharacterized protein YjbI with pentapeptide repeats